MSGRAVRVLDLETGRELPARRLPRARRRRRRPARAVRVLIPMGPGATLTLDVGAALDGLIRWARGAR